jgi:glycosyltransferase involved in cell wall biosynthesis
MTIDVLIPTYGRSALLGPLVANLADVTPPDAYTLILVVDYEDEPTRAELRSLGARHLLADGTFPEKTNAGFAASASDLVLSANDDVVFHPGWYEATVEAFEDEGIQVVGCSDMSPGTANRMHATMPTARRSYAMDPGASWDLPGQLMFEGYHHNFSETEIWRVAEARDVAGWSEAVIEHRHPVWGTREVDPTYERGGMSRSHFEADQATFLDRQRMWERVLA